VIQDFLACKTAKHVQHERPILFLHDEVNRKFDGRLDEVIKTMQANFQLSPALRKAA